MAPPALGSKQIASGNLSPGTQQLSRQTEQKQNEKNASTNSEASSGENAGQASQNAPGQLTSDRGDGRSLREKFNVDTHTGGVSFRVPIRTSPGRNGFGPSLELVYDSGSASSNGAFGVGWHLNGVDSINRKSSVMISVYDDDEDTFVHSSAGDLVPVIQGEGSNDEPVEWDDTLGDTKYRVRLYQPRVESNPLRVERWRSLDGSGNIKMHWKAIASGNVVTIFGQDTSSRITGRSGEQELVFSWLATEVYDGFGNQMVFTYKGESRSTQRYLKSIKYGNKRPNRDMKNWTLLHDASRDDSESSYWAFEVIFDYGEHPGESPTTREDPAGWTLRPDPFSVHTSGFEIRTYRRCERVLMFHHFEELGRQDYLVAATEFKYETNSKSGVSVLKSCVQCGYQLDQSKEKLSCIRLPPNQFEYWEAPDLGSTSIEEFDLDLAGLTTPNVQWIDLNGDGAPGVLAKVLGGGWYYHSNNSSAKPAIGKPSLVSRIPSLTDSNDWSFEDLNGDGQLDFVFVSPSLNIRGFYGRLSDEEWSTFVPMESYPTDYSASDPTIKKLDLTGNGHADMLRLTAERGDELSWYPSLGRLGYGTEKRTAGAPPVPSGDERMSVVICDMTGDGLSDIAMIYNNHIYYWPNMGHGRFGSKVVMNNPPFLADNSSFNPLRMRMADITGSGAADLIYLPPEGGVHVYYNHSGNGWSDAHVLPAFPPLDKLCAVDVFDIGGRGTQCLVWTSDHLTTGSTTVRFIDLMGGCKPGVLTKCTNGIGGEVEMSYRSSTHYHLDDQQAGRPWTTRLPFPINCVERVITKDLIAETSCTMRYAYHNGSYDPVERQFRGFQMVEEWDAEDFSSLSTQKFHRPPVHTKTWFYVGWQQLDETTVLPGCFSTDSCQQSPLPTAKVSSRFASDQMITEEIQDAYRALAGKQRRQEVFSNDGSSKSTIPYVITQQTYEVTMHQKIHMDQRYGRFRVNSREELASHYERELSEAMVQHTVTLETDDYGNVCKEAVINYGKPDSKLEKDEDRQKQQQTFIAYTETDYTNAIDPLVIPGSKPGEHFRAALPSEVRQYRIFPGSLWASNSTNQYSWEALAASLSEAGGTPSDDLSYAPASLEKGSRKLISKMRTLYSTADLTGQLPLHKLEPLSVDYQSYQLALTRKLLETTLKDGNSLLLDASELGSELANGGFVQLDQNDEWWTPSSRKLFKDSIEDDSSSSSLSAAQSHFYMSNAEIDPFGNVSHQQMDKYQLLPVKSINTVKSEISFENDYVHLQPKLVIDANGNRTQTVFDACGRPVGIAAMGKATETVGDSLDGFSLELSPEKLEQFINDPLGPIAAQLLSNVGRRTIYWDHYQRDTSHGKVIPSFHGELVRDTHYQDTTTPLQIAVHITYLDGHGEAIQEVSLSGNTEEKKQWQFSGWVIRDNKRQPVKQFLPFTAATHDFRTQTDSLSAPATTMLRDPLDRVVAVLNTDHTWSKTRFSPWTQVDFDAGDTISIEDPATDQDVGSYFITLDRNSYFPTWKRNDMTAHQAVAKSEAYHDTPTTTYKDALGRNIIVEVDNGPLGSGRDTRATRMKYGIHGDKVVELRDALDRVVAVTQYDLLGRPLHSINMDSGSRWLLPDCLGSPFLSWSSRGDRKRIVYDKLRRIEQVKVRLPSGRSSEIVVTKNTYGESQSDARRKNLNGQLYQCHDQSGLQTNKRFDFHGNCAESSVRYAVEYKQILDWSKEDTKLEDREYESKASFNAIGKEVHVVIFSGESVRRIYDVANRLKTLKSLAKDGTTITSVDKIEYSEDSKITSIDYGNGSRTTHNYDKRTRKLIKTCTKRIKDGTNLEDVTYIYDCLGRVVYKDNRAQQTVYFDNNIVSPSQEFQYDALGQLLKATGREQVDASKDGQKQLRPYDTSSGRNNLVPGDGRQMIEYIETYEYDLAGNILKMQHAPRTAKDYSGWTRTYTYEEPSCINPKAKGNRMSSTAIGKATETYGYDDDAGRNGCMTSIPGYSMLTWDHNDRLCSFSSQRVAEGATPEMIWYVYDAQGKRVRKITERSAPNGNTPPPTRSKETRYLPLQDVYTTYSGDGSSISRTITTASVGDASLAGEPIALVEYDSSTKQQVIRYQISENLELNDSSQIVSYEEYSPYGSSTYQARTKGVPRKYRFMRYQRDCESGLYICGERYYAPWLGRWTSPDPIGTADGLNIYAYVSNDPVNFDDYQGTVRRNVGEPSTRPSGLSRRMEKWIKNSSRRDGEEPLVKMIETPHVVQPGLSNRQIAEGKLNRPVQHDQVRLPLGMIKFSQSAISPQVHNPRQGGALSDVGQEIRSLKREVSRLQKREGLSLTRAESRAASEFLENFGQINITLVMGAGGNSGNEKNGWYSMDNRRLAIMKGALSKGAEITARFASQEEYFGMVRLSPPDPDGLDTLSAEGVVKKLQNRELFDKIYNRGYDRGWDELSAVPLKKFFKGMKGKWSTKNDGSSIRISG